MEHRSTYSDFALFLGFLPLCAWQRSLLPTTRNWPLCSMPPRESSRTSLLPSEKTRFSPFRVKVWRFSLWHADPVVIVKTVSPFQGVEGFIYNHDRLIYFAHHYQVLKSDDLPTISDLCQYNATVCRESEAPAIEVIWLMLKDLVEALHEDLVEHSRIRSRSSFTSHTPCFYGSLS